MQKPLVLILDDHENYLNTAKDALTRSGYTVISAQEPRVAQDILQEQKQKIDLAIIDIRLYNDPENKNERTGLDFAQRYTHDMPVIIVTKERDWDILRDAFRQFNGVAPVADFVFKDEGVTSLIAAVGRVLRYRANVQLPYRSIWGEPNRGNQFQCDVFMIMPFAEEFTDIYELDIKPTIESSHMTIKRGDVFHSKAAIISEVWSAISNAKLIIADCTGKNPNVFYELGIAHTLGKPTILITQEIEDIPFDLRHLRFIAYETTHKGLVRFQTQLAEAISIMLDEN